MPFQQKRFSHTDPERTIRNPPPTQNSAPFRSVPLASTHPASQHDEVYESTGSINQGKGETVDPWNVRGYAGEREVEESE